MSDVLRPLEEHRVDGLRVDGHRVEGHRVEGHRIESYCTERHCTERYRVEVVRSLRALAALMVAVHHFTSHSDSSGSFFPEGSWQRVVGAFGHHGVDVFFVISGFVLPLSLSNSGYQWRNAGRYLLKRFTRLFPPALASMCIYLLVFLYYWVRAGAETPIIFDWPRIAHNLFLTAELFGFQWYQGLFWTLAVEAQFYLLLALICPLIFSRTKWISWSSLAVFLNTSYLFGYEQQHIILFWAPLFTFGMLACLYQTKRLNLLELLLMLLYCGYVTYYELSAHRLYFAAVTTLVICFVRFRFRFLERIGDFSYSLYLTHDFSGCKLLHLYARYTESLWQKMLLLLAAVIYSTLFAWGFARLFEIPSLRLSQKIRFKPELNPAGLPVKPLD